ncbi:unnamed protein product [Meganyctiphanes norvegica]|uniref:Peroxidase n=1 Tax=Meganyctiphanes norvegica TaxID=48144 RepID=A0AAV2PY66_MEGNR
MAKTDSQVPLLELHSLWAPKLALKQLGSGATATEITLPQFFVDTISLAYLNGQSGHPLEPPRKTGQTEITELQVVCAGTWAHLETEKMERLGPKCSSRMERACQAQSLDLILHKENARAILRRFPNLPKTSYNKHKPNEEQFNKKMFLNKIYFKLNSTSKNIMKKHIVKILFRKKIVLKRGTPASNHLRVFKKGPHTAQKDMDALTIAMATSHMKTSAPLRDCTTSGKVEVKTSILRNMCPVMPKCSNPNSKYRTADGSCNNIKNPDWGMSETPLARLLPPKYEDCIRSPRNTSVKGGPLPLPRTLSSNILIDNNKPDSQFTLSVMQWGQFMDHDLSLTPFEAMEHEGGEEGIRCCTEGNKEMLPESEQHPMCFPIEIPEGDGFFAPRKQRCMNFVRSQLAPGFDCRFGPVEQVNDLTHWIDASTVYGQNQHDQDRVRTKQNGTLKTSGNNSLPIDNDAFECDAPNRGGVCYLAGESRVNEQPILAVLHTVWMRQHNHIARQLKDINSQWSDEAVFQETRRIVAAQFQHITYNEWLPVIVG